MRIVILGDFHIDEQYPELTVQAMEDVAQVSPDLVIPLGDFGRKGLSGRPEGMEEAKGYLDSIGAPLRPIMGNHDLERESGGMQPKGTMEAAFLRLFQLSEPYGVLEFADWRLFFASTEPQPEDSCYDVQECYVTDRQFAALAAKLKERPGVPVIFFTHAPPIGSGLRTVPRVHVRSTNAYLDQNHNLYRWWELVRTFPEIVMWFSAHYHLSHGYANSHTFVQGTHFFLTGVHSSFTRDGKRQSRILDIDPGGVSVRTLDHASRRITEEGAFLWGGKLTAFMEMRTQRSVLALSVAVPDGPPDGLPSAAAVRLIRECHVGEGPAIPYGTVSLLRNRYLVATCDGFSWEAEPETSAVLGTLHLGLPLRGIAATANTGWLAWDRHLGSSTLSSPWRFVRREEEVWPESFHSFEQPVEALAPMDGERIHVAADGWLWEAAASTSGLTVAPVIQLPERCRQLTADGEQVWMVGQSGTLYQRAADGGTFIPVRERIAAWDAWKEESAALITAADHYEVEMGGGQHMHKYPIPVVPAEADTAQIICLGEDSFVLTVQGKAYAGGGHLPSPVLLNGDDATRVHAVSRCLEDSRQFAVSAVQSGESAGLLQIWQF